MVYSLTFPMVFKAALELGVIDTMATVEDGVWLSPSEIASRLPTKPTNPEAPMMLDRMMRLLASHSVFKCRVVETGENAQTGKTERIYAAEPVCKFFLKASDGSGSLRSLFMSHLKDVILQGTDAFISGYGMKVFEYLAVDEQFSEMFDPGMSESSTMVMKKVLGKYTGFEDVNTLVDVGGGVGTVLGIVTSMYPHIKGINLDLASVLVNATPYPGVQHVAGDMFVEIPKGDALFMKWILHAWNDENCVKILKNCWTSLPDKGKVIVLDVVMRTEPKCYDFASNMELTMDMFILSQRSGGRERTLPELEALGCAAGFGRCEFICRAYSFSLIEFHKLI
uniref:O-methyltransferase domain-containing protein n=1 Tax=Brassica campestris TaxID=3711 RepID=M4CHJ8_BRACM